MFEYARQELQLIRSGERFRDRLGLAAMSVRLHLAARGMILPGNTGEREIQLQGLHLRARRNDFVLFEILGFGGYDIDLAPLGPISTVLDIGANIGLATVYLSQRLPTATFFCVEPSEHSYRLLVENLSRNVPGARALRAAATPTHTTVAVQEGLHPGLTRVGPPAAANGNGVPGMTIRELLDDAAFTRADLMKLDIEGGEAQLIEVAVTWCDYVGAVLAEIHAPLTVQGAADRLAVHGYTRLPLPAEPKFDDFLLVVRRPSVLNGAEPRLA